jgi:hypothetical protein
MQLTEGQAPRRAQANLLTKQIQVDYVLADEGIAVQRLITTLNLKTSVDHYPVDTGRKLTRKG